MIENRYCVSLAMVSAFPSVGVYETVVAVVLLVQKVMIELSPAAISTINGSS